MLTILIYFAGGFVICLSAAAVVWREKLRSWLSGLIGGTLAQILGTRLAEPGVLNWAQHRLGAYNSALTSMTSCVLGMICAAAIIIILIFVIRKRKTSKPVVDMENA